MCPPGFRKNCWHGFPPRPLLLSGRLSQYYVLLRLSYVRHFPVCPRRGIIRNCLSELLTSSPSDCSRRGELPESSKKISVTGEATPRAGSHYLSLLLFSHPCGRGPDERGKNPRCPRYSKIMKFKRPGFYAGSFAIHGPKIRSRLRANYSSK